MAVLNPTVTRHCPYCDYACPHCLMSERDVYDEYNIRRFWYEYECCLPEGEKCVKESEESKSATQP